MTMVTPSCAAVHQGGGAAPVTQVSVFCLKTSPEIKLLNVTTLEKN